MPKHLIRSQSFFLNRSNLELHLDAIIYYPLASILWIISSWCNSFLPHFIFQYVFNCLTFWSITYPFNFIAIMQEHRILKALLHFNLYWSFLISPYYEWLILNIENGRYILYHNLHYSSSKLFQTSHAFWIIREVLFCYFMFFRSTKWEKGNP